MEEAHFCESPVQQSVRVWQLGGWRPGTRMVLGFYGNGV